MFRGQHNAVEEAVRAGAGAFRSVRRQGAFLGRPTHTPAAQPPAVCPQRSPARGDRHAIPSHCGLCASARQRHSFPLRQTAPTPVNVPPMLAMRVRRRVARTSTGARAKFDSVSHLALTLLWSYQHVERQLWREATDVGREGCGHCCSFSGPTSREVLGWEGYRRARRSQVRATASVCVCARNR